MKILFTGLVVFVLLLLGMYYLSSTGSDRGTPQGNQPQNELTGSNPTREERERDDTLFVETIPAGYRHHGEPQLQYSIALPMTVDVSTPQAGIIRYRYVGPDNEPSSEITDGYTITIAAERTSSNSLRELVEASHTREENDVTASLSTTTIAGYTGLTYTTTAALSGQSIKNFAVLPENGWWYDISLNVSPTNDSEYTDTTNRIINTLHFLSGAESELLKQRMVPIAMLDYPAVGDQYVKSSSGVERGCDRVVLIDHVFTTKPTRPLKAALAQLFAYDHTTVGGWQNYVAEQTDTLQFDKVGITSKTAHVYLTGELSSLGGVCDGPRTAIQIEETALAFAGVETVELYLNGETTDLIPSGQ